MNSIRWMPMIRWLKFPFRVHILHKTVQLSVHKLRGGYVCMRLKACPTVPPSPWEQGGTACNIFLCFCILSLWSMAVAPVLFWCFIPSVAQLSCRTIGSENMLWAIESHYILFFYFLSFFKDWGDSNDFLSVQSRNPQHPIVKILVKFQHSI